MHNAIEASIDSNDSDMVYKSFDNQQAKPLQAKINDDNISPNKRYLDVQVNER